MFSRIARRFSAMASSRRTQPPWSAPSTKDTAITLVNGLTRAKNKFHPLEEGKIKWYACGPTVYDDAHVGHARNYVSTDIVRRILTDYFGFDVRFVMNITDVDDKIIVKARETKLFDDFVKNNPSTNDGRETISEAFQYFLRRKFPDFQYTSPETFEVDLQQHVSSHPETSVDALAKIKLNAKILTAASNALRQPSLEWKSVEDIVKPYLDSKHGKAFDQYDHAPFNAIARKYEARFFEDMDRLNVRRPDLVTRVTEYGPQIVEFVQRIVDRGFAYESEGSVYFDIDAFERAGKPYARLQPWNRNDAELQADGEGALSKGGAKRSDADFALWKASKPGEPAWQSPWGSGRPGWHIECSAMASKELGQHIDIHSGGIDLAFPHHDNELAQSEAYWHAQFCDKTGFESQWINYFMHMGHLHIGGAKMSKSLKNFTTIREDLKIRTPRMLRMIFLMGSWSQPMEITDSMLLAVKNMESTISNFFFKAKDVERRAARQLRQGDSVDGVSKSGADSGLEDALSRAQQDIHEALADSFDTARAMQTISELITQFNSAEKSTLQSNTSLRIAQWVTRMIDIFGLNTTKQSIGWEGSSVSEDIATDVYKISDLRDDIRLQAKGNIAAKKPVGITLGTEEIGSLSLQDAPSQVDDTKSPTPGPALAEITAPRSERVAHLLSFIIWSIKDMHHRQASPAEVLAFSDKIRDLWLWDLGVYLEDSVQEGQPAVARPLDDELIQARQEADERKRAKAEQDRRKREEKARKEAEEDTRARQDPLLMFKTAEYSAWDEQGIPIKLADGTDPSKSRLKSLKKDWDRQKKRHDEWRRRQGMNSAS